MFKYIQNYPNKNKILTFVHIQIILIYQACGVYKVNNFTKGQMRLRNKKENAKRDMALD